MFVGAGALPLLRLGLLQRFQRALDADGLGPREVLAAGVLGELAAHDLVKVDRYQRAGNCLPAEHLDSTQTALASDEMSVGRDGDWMQQPDLVNAFGERGDITKITPMTLADGNATDGQRARISGNDRLIDRNRSIKCLGHLGPPGAAVARSEVIQNERAGPRGPARWRYLPTRAAAD